MNVTEYISEFIDRATDLSRTKLAVAPSLDMRNQKVSDMINHYFSYVGDYPKSYVLTLLSNYILIDELKDKDVDKVAKKAYPILSDDQLNRRQKKQWSVQDDNIDFLHSKFHKRLDSLSKTTIKKQDY